MSVNQKLENLLNLSLDTTAKERSRSAELETGYNPEEQTWELIVKYSGSLDAALPIRQFVLMNIRTRCPAVCAIG